MRPTGFFVTDSLQLSSYLNVFLYDTPPSMIITVFFLWL